MAAAEEVGEAAASPALPKVEVEVAKKMEMVVVAPQWWGAAAEAGAQGQEGAARAVAARLVEAQGCRRAQSCCK